MGGEARPTAHDLFWCVAANTIRRMVSGEAKGTASCTHRFFGMFRSCTADHSDVSHPTAPPVRALSLQLRGQYRKRPKVHEARNGRLQAIPRRDAALAASRTEWKAPLAWLPSQSAPTWRRPLTGYAYCTFPRAVGDRPFAQDKVRGSIGMFTPSRPRIGAVATVRPLVVLLVGCEID